MADTQASAFGDIPALDFTNDRIPIIDASGTGNAKNKLIAPSTLLTAPIVALAYGATISPAASGGAARSVTMTGNATLNVPSGATAGMVWRGIFTASGAARDLTLAAGFKLLTGAAYGATIASGSIRVIDAYYTGTSWLVTKNQEFAP